MSEHHTYTKVERYLNPLYHQEYGLGLCWVTIGNRGAQVEPLLFHEVHDIGLAERIVAEPHTRKEYHVDGWVVWLNRAPGNSPRNMVWQHDVTAEDIGRLRIQLVTLGFQRMGQSLGVPFV